MKKSKYGTGFLILSILVLAGLAANLCAGSVDVPLAEVLQILAGKQADQVHKEIIMEIRFPRSLAAAILGGGLALSGYLLQTFFHNPIAGPFILGISSGAKLAVALVMVFFLEHSIHLSSGAMVLAAFAGAMASMGFVLLMARMVDHMSMLIVSGVMIGYICSAVTDFVVAFADDGDIVNLHNWSKGSFSGIGWEQAGYLSVVVFPAFLCCFLLSKPVSAYELGEAYAQNMGLSVRKFRIVLVVLSSVLSACVTAFAGPISFVGIAVPHMVKYLFHTSRPVFLIPACFLGGAAFCLLCDLLARVLFAPRELSISTITAVFGAPVVIAVMMAKNKRRAG